MKRAPLICLAIYLLCSCCALEAIAQRLLPNGKPIPEKSRILPTRSKKTCNEEERHDLLERAERAATILREFMDSPDRGLSQAMMDRSQCVAVVPAMKKGGFGFGGQWGRGLLSCRFENKTWTPPVFFTLTGGSFGLQIGLEVTDLVMIISTRSGVRSLLQNKVELGAGAGATALLFGRNVGVSTDPLLDARVFSYSRSRGLYAGLDLRGVFFQVDDTANCVLYGEKLSNGDLLHTHDMLSRETLPSTPQGSRATEVSVFSRALKDISPVKVVYVKVPRSRLQQPPSQQPAGQPASGSPASGQPSSGQQPPRPPGN